MRRGFTDTRLAKYMQTASNSISDILYRPIYTVPTKIYSRDQRYIEYRPKTDILNTLYTYRSKLN